jgi:hypothetical protein
MRYILIWTALMGILAMPLLIEDAARDFCDWQIASQRGASCLMNGTQDWKYAQVAREAREASAAKQRLAQRIVMPRLERRGRDLERSTLLLYVGVDQHFPERRNTSVASR